MALSVEKVGSSVEEAVQAALDELGVSIDDVVVEVLEEGQSAAEGGYARPCRVLVTYEEHGFRYFGDEAESEVQEEDDLPVRAKEFLSRVLDTFDLTYHLDAKLEDNVLQLDISGPECGIIIGRGGETLSALQYLTSLVVNRHRSEPVHTHVDAGGYRKRYEESLASLARRTAAKVARSGRTFEMKPMSPADRRVIHFALQNFRGVETFSEGEGEERRVIIAPTRHDS